MSSGQSVKEGEEDVAVMNSGEVKKSKTNIQLRMRQGHERMHKSLLRSVDRYTLVLSIVLVLSYVGILRPPQPFDNDNNGDHMLRFCVWRKIFFSFNGLSFFFSACGLLLCASLTFSPSMFTYAHSSNYIEEEMSVHIRHLAIDMPKVIYMAMFLSFSLIFCAISYTSAGLAITAEEKSSAQLAVLIPSAVGSYVFLQAFFIFVRDLFDFWKEVRVSDVELWEAMKAGSVFGGIRSWYVEKGLYKVGVTSTQQHRCEKGENG